MTRLSTRLSTSAIGVAAALLLAAAACDDPTEPRPDQWIEIGVPEFGRLPADSAARDTLRFVVPEGHLPALIAEADGLLRMTVTDPAGQTVLATEVGYRTSWTVDQRAGGEYVLVLRHGISAPAPVEYTVTARVIDPRPEHRTPNLPSSVVVTDEPLESGLDRDEFLLSAADGEQLNIFLKPLSDVTNLWVFLEHPSGHRPLVDFAGADTARGGYSGRILLDQAGDYRLLIHAPGAGPAVDPIPYRLEIYRSDPAPEHVDSVLLADIDKTGERIDEIGDFDLFVFDAAAGQVFDIFFDATIRGSTLVSDPFGTRITEIESRAGPPWPSATGFIEASESGRYHIQVDGSEAGEYSLLVHEIDTAPEHEPQMLLAGDSVLEEQIEAPTDLDRFRVSIDDSLRLSVAFVRPAGVGGALIASVGQHGTTLRPDHSAEILGPYALGSEYAISVQGAVHEGVRFTGPYRMYTSWSSTWPETVARTIEFGDTIAESVQPMADSDLFLFPLVARQHYEVQLQGLGEPGADDILGWTGASGVPPIGVVHAPSSSSTLAAHSSRRLTPRTTGIHEVRVDLGRITSSWTDGGHYRIVVMLYPSAPEAAAVDLAVGDSLTESLEVEGDVDRFEITGSPDQWIVIGTSSETNLPEVLAEAFLPGNPDSIVAESSIGTSLRVTRAQLDGTGHLSVEVLERMRNFTYGATGRYSLFAWTFDPRPEENPGSLALGSPVQEALDPPGDVDEYLLSVSPGHVIEVILGRPVDGAAGTYYYTVDVESEGQILRTIQVGFEPGGTSTIARVTASSSEHTIRVRPYLSTEGPHEEPYVLEVR